MFLAAKPKQRKVPENVKRYVKREIRKENQDLDTYVSVTFEDAAYNTESMNDLTPASGLIDGARFRIKELDVRYQIQAQTAAGGQWVRVILFQWFGDDGSDVPVLEDVLKATGDQYSVIDLYDDTSIQSHHMKPLYDRVHMIGENTSLDGRDIAYGKVRLFTKNLPRKYLKGTGSGVGFNKIYCLALSNQAAGASAPHFAVKAKLLHEIVEQN